MSAFGWDLSWVCIGAARSGARSARRRASVAEFLGSSASALSRRASDLPLASPQKGAACRDSFADNQSRIFITRGPRPLELLHPRPTPSTDDGAPYQACGLHTKKSRPMRAALF